MIPDMTEDLSLRALSNLSAGLWRIQELLETLTFKLETQQVLIEAGRSRWMGRTTREIELILEQLREAELMRTIDAGPVCAVLGLDPETPLSEIAAAAPAPWSHVLDEHRTALTKASQELAAMSRSNTELLQQSYTAVRDALDRFNHSTDTTTYTAKGSLQQRSLHHLIDHAS